MISNWTVIKNYINYKNIIIINFIKLLVFYKMEMNLEWEKTDGESKLSKSPFIIDSSYFLVFNSTIKYKDIKNINIKSIFKLSITVFDSIVSPPCR